MARLLFRSKNSIKRMLFIIAYVFTFSAIGYFASVNHRHFERAMIEQAQAQLFIIAKSEAQSIEKYISDIQDELEVLSLDPTIRRITTTQYSKGARVEYYGPLEASYRGVKKLVDAIYLINSSGVVLSSSPFREGVAGEDLSGLPDVKAVLADNESRVSRIFTTAGSPAISVLQPIFEQDKPVGLFRAVIFLDRIDNLLSHINQFGQGYAIVIDSNSEMLSGPIKEKIGSSVSSILKGRPAMDMAAGREGTAILMLPSAENLSKEERTLMAYTPIEIENGAWSIAVTRPYAAISKPIGINTRDNIFFMAFILVVLIVMGSAFLRSRKKQTQLAVSAEALKIINKQLHLDIDKRKDVEEALNKCIEETRRKVK